MNTLKFYKIFLLLLPLLLCKIIQAQECDTIIKSKDTNDVQYFYNNVDSLALGKLHPVSTKMHNAQYYKPFHKQHPFFASLGNVGLAYRNLIFTPDENNTFNFGSNSFETYQYSNLNTEYYKLQEPYSELYYVMGAKKEQLFRASPLLLLKSQTTKHKHKPDKL